MSNVVALGGRALSVGEIVAASTDGTELCLTPAARAAIAKSREVVARYAAGDAPIYGLNTGLGGNLGHRVPAAAIEAFQEQIVRGRMIGLGEPLPRSACRAALLCRIVELASGRTGVSAAAIDALIALFNRGVTPVLPRYGSLGASDMGLASHMIAVAFGRGEAWFGEQRLDGAAALAAADLRPVRLAPKDGLGLISHGPVTTAVGALALAEVGSLLAEHAAVAALAFEGYRANPSIFDERLHAAHPAAGQVDAAAAMRRLLEGSYLCEPDGPAHIQDALCFREVAPVLGTAAAAHQSAVRELEIELNGVTCSPMVLIEDGEMLSSPNFHRSSLALAFDALAIALTHAAWGSALRVCKLMTGALSGLPKYLSPVGGASAGYVSLQKTAGSLFAEIRLRAAPAMLDSLPVSDTVEDMAPHAFLSVRKLEEQLPALRYLTAIEAVAAAQAVDLRKVASRLAPATHRVYAALREAVPALAEDREPSIDVESARRALDAPALRMMLRSVFEAEGRHG
jgi:histidine ammonia-lyase